MTSKAGRGSRFTAAIPLPQVGEGDLLKPEESAKVTLGLPPGKRILLAEDNPINRMIAERFLAGTGATVEAAETGRVAVARHAAHPYDLILMDCHMPDMDGFEATAAIRTLREGADVPIVAVTASAFAEDRERCRRAGMDGYVAKPLRREELIRAVAAALTLPIGKKAG
jgi:CheY-like chemotaxis protein